MNKIVYVVIAGEEVRLGHIDMIAAARKRGDVTVGILTDSAISRFKPLPLLDFAPGTR